MDELVKELKNIYIERIANIYPPQRILVFFAYLFFVCILKTKPSDVSLIDTLMSFEVKESLPLLSSSTFGDIFRAAAFTLIILLVYKQIKKKVFLHFSEQKGFFEITSRWSENTKKVVSPKHEYNQAIAESIRKRINKKKKSITSLHFWGELLLSISSCLIVGIYPFHRVDVIASFSLFIIVLVIQRRAYIFYLKKMLPELVSEAVFLGGEFSHQQVFLKEFEEETSASA